MYCRQALRWCVCKVKSSYTLRNTFLISRLLDAGYRGCVLIITGVHTYMMISECYISAALATWLGLDNLLTTALRTKTCLHIGLLSYKHT